MNDPVDLVRQIAPPVEAQPDLLARVRSDFMTTITKGVEEETVRPLRRRRRWAIPIAAVAVFATAAAGWAVLQDSSSSSTVQCPGNTFIDAVTGNPVADCADEWRRSNGSEPPPMVAYDNGRGGVVVLLGSEAIPDSYVALPGGSYQDTALIELKAALNDASTGLSARCVDEKTARDITRRELDRLGLTDWTIQVGGASPDGSTTCAHFDLEPNQQQVQLIASRQSSRGANPYAAFAAALHDRLKSECVGLDRAADLTRSLGAAANIVVNGNHIVLTEEAGVLVIHTIEDSSSGCTRANVSVGGRVEVNLRGPT